MTAQREQDGMTKHATQKQESAKHRRGLRGDECAGSVDKGKNLDVQTYGQRGTDC